MDEIDKLLAEIKSDRGEKKPTKSPLDALLNEVKTEIKENKPQAKQPSIFTVSYSSTSEENDLIKELQAEKKPTKSPLDALLNEVKTEIKENKTQTKQPSSFTSVAESNLVKELQAEMAEKAKAEKQQQELKEKQEKEALKRQAEEWLKKLDPHSDEGFWFEQFSYSYSSKIEAALDYLQALQS